VCASADASRCVRLGFAGGSGSGSGFSRLSFTG